MVTHILNEYGKDANQVIGGGGDVVDLDECGDDLILLGDGGPAVVILQMPGLVQ